ncbi:MAG: hypothetical protein ACI4UJ_02600 [Candidatus Cryptobacteroides sp.]
MKRIYSIFAFAVMILAGNSCVETACPVNNAPVIVSITSLPDTHSAILISDLNSEPSGKLECGFYFGKDRTTLTRMVGRIEGKSIVLDLNDLEAGTTYYFKAFVSNGRNEIGSGFESFITEEETSGPGDGGDDIGGGPGDPGGPGGPGDNEDPGGSGGNGGTEDPEPEPVEFTTEINTLSVNGDESEICISVTLNGDASLVKKALIYIGYTADEMVETECPVKDGSFSSIYYGLEPGGTYFYKASISNGIETKTSGTFSFTVAPSAA